MPPLNFLPFSDGEKISANDLNQLVQAIMDGTIFSGSVVGVVEAIITPLSASVLNLQSQVAVLQTYVQQIAYREQFQMANGQSTISLSNTPSLDSELVLLNGISLSKDGLPPGYTGDYSISGSVITL